MNVQDFIEHPPVHHALSELRDECDGKRVSDLIDDEDHQYVDLVMEGGGVLGVALVGYTYALEQVGIRFKSIGGTSAGSINALLMAAAAPPAHPRAGEVLSILGELDMFQFVDGGGDAKDLVNDLVDRKGSWQLLRTGRLVSSITRNMPEIMRNNGANPGDAFLLWLTDQLAGFEIRTVDELDARMNDFPPMRLRRDGEVNDVAMSELNASLKVVAAEVTTTTKAVFPEMAKLYFECPGDVNPAKFVRASMSIPFFFEPYEVDDIPRGVEAMDLWKEEVGYKGEIPESVYFLDGGIMSNFPINLFHPPPKATRRGAYTPPRCPTFGVKLGASRTEPREVNSPFSLIGTMFSAARQATDMDFLWRNKDYSRLIRAIDTGEADWLNFAMEDDEKKDLFAAGVCEARTFLGRFDWEEYKKTRAMLAGVPEVPPGEDEEG